MLGPSLTRGGTAGVNIISLRHRHVLSDDMSQIFYLFIVCQNFNQQVDVDVRALCT